MIQQQGQQLLDNGHVLLTVRGEEGAVRADVWRYQDQPIGVLTIHATSPQRPGQAPEPCPVQCPCYDGGLSHLGGFKVAELFFGHQEQAAFDEMALWYARLTPGVAV